MNVFSKVFGTRSQREVKRIMPLVEKTESYQSQMQQLTDEQLRDKTREYKKRLAEGATLDDLLPEAFATEREAAMSLSQACAWNGALPCTDHRWYHPSPGPYRRDENR